LSTKYEYIDVIKSVVCIKHRCIVKQIKILAYKVCRCYTFDLKTPRRWSR